MVAILAIAVATTLVLGGTDVTVVAVLREADQVSWTGVVLALWGVYSLIGGFVYGSLSRVPSPVVLLGLLALGTLLVALAGAAVVPARGGAGPGGGTVRTNPRGGGRRGLPPGTTVGPRRSDGVCTARPSRSGWPWARPWRVG